MPKLNLKFSVLSDEAWDKAFAKEKLSGPIGVKRFKATPVDDLMVLLLMGQMVEFRKDGMFHIQD